MKDGRRFTVENFYPYAEPSFYLVDDKKMKLPGSPSDDGNYSFYHMEGGGPECRYNETTGEWEYDHDNIMPGMEVLNLILKPLKEVEPSVLPVIEEKKDEILSVQSSLMPLTSISFKEDLPVKIVPSYKIVKLPDVIKNKDSKGFYVCHDTERNVWVGLEYLTEKSIQWWRKRLGNDAFMHFNSQIKVDMEMKRLIPDEVRLQMEDSSGTLMFSPNFEPFAEAREFIGLCEGVYDYEFLSLSEKLTSSLLSKDYLSAWRGFKHNLDQSGSVPTWVAYVSSRPVKGPLHEILFPTSSDIKMAMTVTHGGPFYSPLGIYRSPIACAYEERHGLKRFNNLSLLLHSSVARMMGKIETYQEIKYAVVRPLTHMKKVLEKSGISFSSSFGEKNTTTFPSILHSYYQKDKEIDFGDGSLVLFDPRSSEVYQIGKEHWFAKSPFLAGIDDWRLVKAFPFITLDREELAKL